MKNLIMAGLAFAIVILLLLKINPPPKDQNQEETPMPNTTSLPKPDLTLNPQASYSATLNTSEGEIELALDTKNTPITANNFVYLARSGFYDNTIFHRVLEGFMIQGGDPTGTGRGGPGYRFDDEQVVGEYTRGTVAMANAGPNTNGSQFFIMHADYSLPRNYVIFGYVTSGMDVVDKIASAPTQINSSGENSSPVSPVTITSVVIKEE